MASGGQLPHHDLGIDKVFRATQTDETDFQGVDPGQTGVKFQDGRGGERALGRAGPTMRIAEPKAA